MQEILKYDISDQQIGFLVCIIVMSIIISIEIFLIIKYRFVKGGSKYKEIEKINSWFHFHDLQDTYIISKPHKSKAQFDRFDYTKFLEDEIESNIDFYKSIVVASEENIKWEKQYQKRVENVLVHKDKSDDKRRGLFSILYQKFERKVLTKNVLHPVLAPKILCKSSYVSPKGRNSYYDERTFPYPELIKRYNFVCQRIKEKASKEYQRKIMTDSLRYDIMKRDGFKCVLCGRSAEDDGVKLHIDHIVPVSKGGQTNPSNLRTLCETCNSGKSDKYDEYGKN